MRPKLFIWLRHDSARCTHLCRFRVWAPEPLNHQPLIDPDDKTFSSSVPAIYGHAQQPVTQRFASIAFENDATTLAKEASLRTAMSENHLGLAAWVRLRTGSGQQDPKPCWQRFRRSSPTPSASTTQVATRGVVRFWPTTAVSRALRPVCPITPPTIIQTSARPWTVNE